MASISERAKVEIAEAVIRRLQQSGYAAVWVWEGDELSPDAYVVVEGWDEGKSLREEARIAI